jgi:hypothetical protein
MAPIEEDAEREERIVMEIIVDAYDSEERAMGWYVYLDNTLSFPFTAHCIAERAVSPLQIGDEVEVVEMAPEEECRCEMFVGMRWERRPLAVPLSQLQVVHGDEQTQEAVADWHYWVQQGHSF